MEKANKYTDGFLTVCDQKENKTDFGATVNVKTMADLNKVVKLAFDEKSKREKDLDYCNKLGSDLSLKVVTPLCSKNITNSQKVVIGSMLYDVIYVDTDKKNRELYFYLQEVCEIA